MIDISRAGLNIKEVLIGDVVAIVTANNGGSLE
jgi:hypothetical protein